MESSLTGLFVVVVVVVAGATRCSKGERRESEPEINIESIAIPCKYKITAAKVDFKHNIFSLFIAWISIPTASKEYK